MFYMFRLKKICLAVAVSVLGMTSTAQAMEILTIEQETEQGIVQVQPETNVQEIEVDIRAAEEPIVILSNSGEVEIEDIQEVPQPSEIVITTPGIRAAKTMEILALMTKERKTEHEDWENNAQQNRADITGWLQEQFELAGCSVTHNYMEEENTDSVTETPQTEAEPYAETLMAVRSGADAHADILVLSAHLELREEVTEESLAGAAVLLETARELSELSPNAEIWFLLFIGEDNEQQAFEPFAGALTDLQKERMIADIHFDLTGKYEDGYQVATREGVLSLMSEKLIAAIETVTGKGAEVTAAKQTEEKYVNPFAEAGVPVLTLQWNGQNDAEDSENSHINSEKENNKTENGKTEKAEMGINETVLDEWIRIAAAFAEDIAAEVPQKLARENRASLAQYRS